MIYFLIHHLTPNTAFTNHFIGIVDTLRKNQVPHKLVVMSPSPGFVEIPNIDDYNVNRLYAPFSKSTGWNLLDRVLLNLEHKHALLSKFKFKRFLSKLTSKDAVFVYSADGFLEDLINTGCRVYQERTEHPDASCYLNEEEKKQYLQNVKNLTGIFVITRSLRNFYIQHGVEPEKIQILNMMVNPSRFDGVTKQSSAERYISYCGTASNTKDGVDNLIRAFAIVSKKHTDVKLQIIGKSPNANERNNNIELIKELGIEDKVIFTGQVESAAMPQLLTNAEILALARPNNLQAQYGFPTKLGEYLLTGNPVVITNTGDISLFLKNKESAFIVKPDDSQAFADALCFALENPTFANSVGRKGKEVAIQNFNCEIESQKVIKELTK